MKEYLEKYYEGDIKEALKKLEKGIPVQYIIGNVDFCNVNLSVNKNVLIPRFETEYLTEKTINYIKKFFNKSVKILDIGTGSGAIAITLSKNIKSQVDALDISKKALEVAKTNAKKNKTHVNFFLSDIFSNVNDKYDVIISNPPYIKKNEPVQDIVKNNEPLIALYAENDGLEFYERILKDANKYLNEKFIIAFEIGMSQGQKVTQIAQKYFKKSFVKLEKDLTGKDRYVFIFSETCK